jgi:hypothetical protein
MVFQHDLGLSAPAPKARHVIAKVTILPVEVLGQINVVLATLVAALPGNLTQDGQQVWRQLNAMFFVVVRSIRIMLIARFSNFFSDGIISAHALGSKIE